MQPNVGRSAAEQAGYQLLAVAVSVVVAVVGGAVTGTMWLDALVSKTPELILGCAQKGVVKEGSFWWVGERVTFTSILPLIILLHIMNAVTFSNSRIHPF